MTTDFTRSKYTDATAYTAAEGLKTAAEITSIIVHMIIKRVGTRRKKRKKKEEKTYARRSALQIIKRFCGLTRICSFLWTYYNICTRKE